jgi:predicted DNA-binding transcriptional regulator AlpA
MSNQLRKFGTARQPQQSASVRYLTMRDLPAKGICYHSNHLRRMWSDGRFPVPIHLSPRKLAWAEKVIDEWLAAKSVVQQ